MQICTSARLEYVLICFCKQSQGFKVWQLLLHLNVVRVFESRLTKGRGIKKLERNRDRKIDYRDIHENTILKEFRFVS